MLYAALAVAVIALLVALAARSRAAGLEKKIEEAEANARRRVQNGVEEAEQKLAVLRRLIGRLASGAELTREMIEEGRLWRDASPAQGVQMVSTGAIRILDVRTPQETALGIIPGAQLIPVDQIEARIKELPRDGRMMLVYCAGGGRSAAACEFLSGQGYDELYNLEGGFQSWTGPTAKPK